jgi:hypothetical protein
MRLAKIWAAAAVAASIAGAALAQGFPARSLDQLVAADLAKIREQQKSPKAGDLFFNPSADGGAQSPAVFTGQSRPIDQRRLGFIEAFASSADGNGAYASLYSREYLFQSGGKSHWLPVQAKVASYFAEELKAGTPVTLFLRNAGGFRTDQGWEWVFLVEEFEGPKDAAKPGAKPDSPKLQAVPAGPKIKT